MNQELLVIIKALFLLDRYNSLELHSLLYTKRKTNKSCTGVDCNSCPIASYVFKRNHIKDTLIQIYTLS